MPAGDVTIHGNSAQSVNEFRVVSGDVEMDGSNPTPIDLSSYFSTLSGGVAVINGQLSGTDPSMVTVEVSSNTLNVYLWKYTSTSDTTHTASTANTRVSFEAWGTP